MVLLFVLFRPLVCLPFGPHVLSFMAPRGGFDTICKTCGGGGGGGGQVSRGSRSALLLGSVCLEQTSLPAPQVARAE